MTRKEISQYIKNQLANEDAEIYLDVDDYKVIVEALEQGPILDKVRAEIADLDDADYDYEGYYKAVTDALQIIDKYKAESEVEE